MTRGRGQDSIAKNSEATEDIMHSTSIFRSKLSASIQNGEPAVPVYALLSFGSTWLYPMEGRQLALIRTKGVPQHHSSCVRLI